MSGYMALVNKLINNLNFIFLQKNKYQIIKKKTKIQIEIFFKKNFIKYYKIKRESIHFLSF